MSIAAINLALGVAATPFTQKLVNDLSQFRLIRKNIVQDFAAIDAMRDSGAITIYMAGKVGALGTDSTAQIAEAQKLYDELNSLQGYVASEAANTPGAAILQICAKLGI